MVYIYKNRDRYIYFIKTDRFCLLTVNYLTVLNTVRTSGGFLSILALCLAVRYSSSSSSLAELTVVTGGSENINSHSISRY